MILKKTYYSISEVAKMLNIQEHTIRFWDSKISDLSKNNNKNSSININNIDNLKGDSIKLRQNIVKLKNISKKMKNLLV